MTRTAPWLALVLLVTGCQEVPEAPTELSELIRYLIRELPSEDPRVVEAGIENLEHFLQDVDLDATELEARSFVPDDLQAEDVAYLEVPDYPLGDCVSVAVADRSPWELPWHAQLAIEFDQTPAESAAERYERTFHEPEDPRDFADDRVEFARSMNDVRRANLVYTIDYLMPKDFRWVAVTDDGDPTGRRGYYSPAWIDQAWWGELGNVEMRQSYTLGVWLDGGDGHTWRFHALFADMDIPGITDPDVIRAISRTSIDDTFDAADEAIEELYSP